MSPLALLSKSFFHLDPLKVALGLFVFGAFGAENRIDMASAS